MQPPPQPNLLKRGVSSPYPQPVRQITPSKRRCVDTFPGRNGDTDCKFVSVQKPDNTDDVVAQLSKSITITARQETFKKNDTAAVANMLANRGITVSSVSFRTISIRSVPFYHSDVKYTNRYRICISGSNESE